MTNAPPPSRPDESSPDISAADTARDLLRDALQGRRDRRTPAVESDPAKVPEAPFDLSEVLREDAARWVEARLAFWKGQESTNRESFVLDKAKEAAEIEKLKGKIIGEATSIGKLVTELSGIADIKISAGKAPFLTDAMRRLDPALKAKAEALLAGLDRAQENLLRQIREEGISGFVTKTDGKGYVDSPLDRLIVKMSQMAAESENLAALYPQFADFKTIDDDTELRTRIMGSAAAKPRAVDYYRNVMAVLGHLVAELEKSSPDPNKLALFYTGALKTHLALTGKGVGLFVKEEVEKAAFRHKPRITEAERNKGQLDAALLCLRTGQINERLLRLLRVNI